MADVLITVQGGQISVDKNKVRVSLSGKDTVKWICRDGMFNVVFKPGSNWPNPTTTQNGGTCRAESGPFTSTGSLSYGITAPGATELDPEIEIVP